MYLPVDRREKVRLLDEAFQHAVETRPLREKLRVAARDRLLHKRGEAQLQEAVEKGVLTESEATAVRVAEELRREAIQVDAFASLKSHQ